MDLPIVEGLGDIFIRKLVEGTGVQYKDNHILPLGSRFDKKINQQLSKDFLQWNLSYRVT